MSEQQEKFSPEKDGMLRNRRLEFFHHKALKAWGGPDQTDSFAVLHPVKRKRKCGLYVVLHSAGHDLYSCIGCTLYKGNHDIYHAPEDLFALYLDCRAHQENDFWWGGRRPDEKNKQKERQLQIQPVEKRICAAVEWAIKRYRIDPEQVFLCGNSMGGSGALGIGMARGDLFAAIKVNVPAGIEHVSDRTFQSGRELPDPPVCIDYSAQDDTWSAGHDRFFKSMEEHKYALYAYWADFGHANNDTVMLEKNDLIHTFPWLSLRRNEAYPVFTHADSDTPNPWKNPPEKVPAAGQINGFLRWKKGKDTLECFTMKLFLASKEELGTSFSCPEKVTADLSFRRLQLFKISPGEDIRWEFGSRSGIAKADAQGLLTLEALSFTLIPRTLKLTRIRNV